MMSPSSVLGLSRRCSSFLAQDQRAPRELRAHRWQVEAGGGDALTLTTAPAPLPSEAMGTSAPAWPQPAGTAPLLSPSQCHPSGCITDLFIQMAIIMLLKQTISNVMEFLNP